MFYSWEGCGCLSSIPSDNIIGAVECLRVIECDCWAETYDDYDNDDIGAVDWRWLIEWECWCDTWYSMTHVKWRKGLNNSRSSSSRCLGTHSSFLPHYLCSIIHDIYYGTYSTTRRWMATLNPLQCNYCSSSSSDMMWSLLLQLTTTTTTRCRLTGTSTHRWRPYHNWRSSSQWPVSTTVQYMYLTIPYIVRTVRQINKRKGNQHNYSRYIKNLEVEEKDIINHHN